MRAFETDRQEFRLDSDPAALQGLVTGDKTQLCNRCVRRSFLFIKHTQKNKETDCVYQNINWMFLKRN